MEQITEQLSANPLVFTLVVIGVAILLLSFFRTAVKLLVVAGAAIVLYAGWLQVSGGGDMMETFGQVREALANAYERLSDLIIPLFELLKTLE
jgi:threonine/homoserine/homoserine lactone efflux protein